MAYISIVSKSTTSVMLKLNNLEEKWLSGRKTVSWYLSSANGGTPTETSFDKWAPGNDIEDGSLSGGEVSFSNLKSGSNYCVLCVVYQGSNFVDSVDGEFATIEESPWNSGTHIYVEAITDEQRDNLELFEYYVQIYEFTFAESGTARFYTTGSVDTLGYLSLSANLNSEGSAPASIKASDDDSGDDLNFNIEYEVTADRKYYLFVRGASGSEEGYVTVHIVPPGSVVSVDKWDWSASNGTASADVTYASYCALLNKEPTENFSHLVWNDMVDKVDEILTAKGLYWDSTYAGIYETKMWSEPYELTAKMFNSLRNNIELVGLSSFVNLGYKTGISAVSPGDDVMGWYFTALTEYMNDCIDNL